jgi:hypothetical protein
MATTGLPSRGAIPLRRLADQARLQVFRPAGRDIGYVSSRVRRREEGRGLALNSPAMIDATIFALLVGAVATPVSWWGLSRFG